MKVIAYQKFGNTDVLQTVEETKPSIQSNQVLVKVKAVSVNPMDWKIRKGEMKLMSGSKFPKHTALAEYVAVPFSLIWKKPALISFAQAASIPVVGFGAVTALQKWAI